LRADVVTSTFWIIFGVASVLGSVRLGVGSFSSPGSGFFPLIAAGFVCLTAVIVLMQTILRPTKDQILLSSLWEGVSWYRGAIIVCLITGYVLLLEDLGFLATGFLFMVFVFKGGSLPWRKAVIFSLLVLSGSYIIFVKLLKTPLPKGILGF
jgi:hypothetical protein